MTLHFEFCLHTTSVQFQFSNTWMSTKVGTLGAQHSTPVPLLAPTVMSEEKITYFKCWPGTLTIQSVHKKCTEGVLNLNWQNRVYSKGVQKVYWTWTECLLAVWQGRAVATGSSRLMSGSPSIDPNPKNVSFTSIRKLLEKHLQLEEALNGKAVGM